MEGISLFGTTPCLGIIPVGGIIIPASRMVGKVPSVGGLPFSSEISTSKEVRGKSFVVDESAVDSMVAPEVHGSIESAVSDGAQNEVAPASGEHLDNIGESSFLISFLFLIACSTFLT